MSFLAVLALSAIAIGCFVFSPVKPRRFRAAAYNNAKWHVLGAICLTLSVLMTIG